MHELQAIFGAGSGFRALGFVLVVGEIVTIVATAMTTSIAIANKSSSDNHCIQKDTIPPTIPIDTTRVSPAL